MKFSNLYFVLLASIFPNVIMAMEDPRASSSKPDQAKSFLSETDEANLFSEIEPNPHLFDNCTIWKAIKALKKESERISGIVLKNLSQDIDNNPYLNTQIRKIVYGFLKEQYRDLLVKTYAAEEFTSLPLNVRDLILVQLICKQIPNSIRKKINKSNLKSKAQLQNKLKFKRVKTENELEKIAQLIMAGVSEQVKILCLFWIVEKGNTLKLIDLLAFFDADLNSKKKLKIESKYTKIFSKSYSVPLLHFPLNFGNQKAVKKLLYNGANPDIQNDNLETLLHIAPIQGDLEMAKNLLGHGANPDIKNNKGRTPIHHAVMRHNPALLKILLGHSVDVDIRDKNGMTALHISAQLNRNWAAKMLLDHNADPLIKDNKRITAIDIAKTDKMRKILEFKLTEIRHPICFETAGMKLCGLN